MSRFLFTSDWQIDFGNLQECEQSLDELLAAAAKYKPAAIIHGGDMKDAYDPVACEVVKFAVRMTKRIREAGFRFIVLLGNHDRISQSAESKNWLDVLAAAGAEVVTEPKVKIIAGAALAFVPYFGGTGQERLIDATSGLLAKTTGHSGPRILVLHAEIGGSVMDASGRLGKGPTPEDLHFDDFDAVFSGHIHRHQRLGHYAAWYIGSPFCQDWGEADAFKGHLLCDVGGEKGQVRVQQLRTKIPHWYNVEYLERNGIIPEDGAYVRSKVRVTSKKISDQMCEEEERIRAKYGNVRIHTVADVIDENLTEVILRGSSDQEKVEQYVAATILEDSRFEAGQAVSYMVSKLDGLKEGAAGSAIRFTGVEATNVLNIETIKLKLSKLGLVLIRGINEDWPGRSNGCGKSNMLSLIPIAMFGQNGKGQKSDAWAYEKNDDPATVRLVLRDVANRKIEILRGRRPHSIRLLIDGEDVSSGIRGTGKKETQGLIEQVTGYDMQTLMNAVYIDQAVANGFVFGTPSGRMDLIARFQNLERFELAQKMVGEDIKKCDAALGEMTVQIDTLTADIDDLTAELTELNATVDEQWAEKLKAEKAVLAGLVDEHAALSGTAEFYKELQATVDDLVHDFQTEQTTIEAARKKLHVWQDRLARADKLIASKKCPTCGQDADGVGKQAAKEARTESALVQRELERHTNAAETLGKKKADGALKLDSYEKKVDALEQKIDSSKDRIIDLETAASQEDERNKRVQVARQLKTSQLRMRQRYHQAALGARQGLSIEREMLEYCKKAFHRSGIPLYLSIALCPLLNKAAEEYSDIFTDGNLKVSFRVEDSEFAVDVVNPVGSATVDGQSVGEAAMAGIITAFSLREAAPKTNLLVMDEPGSGLDQEGCKQFARGILKLKDRFETILLVTHSAYIEGLLSGETIYTVKKRRGRSTLFLKG
jgi:DNA repair exonuclease SbcCD nuclease subunit/energy-coupling factor transporter ATP-binding protein EcfA2